jgi:hypothetical protein
VQVAQLEAMGATLYQPGQQVKTNFGVVGFLDGMSSDGVKFVSVRGALLCTPTADTEVHDALLAAAQEVCASLPKRKRRDPGWFADEATTLHPLLERRDTAVAASIQHPTSKPLRALTRRARKQAKDAVVIAKEAWWVKHIGCVNRFRSRAEAWRSIKLMLGGLQTVRKATTRKMRKDVDDLTIRGLHQVTCTPKQLCLGAGGECEGV